MRMEKVGSRIEKEKTKYEESVKRSIFVLPNRFLQSKERKLSTN